jgi:hypothetical protein
VRDADRRAAAKDRDAEPRKIVVACFEYHYNDGTLAFVVERIEYRNPDGSPVLTKDGKPKKRFRQKRPDPDRPGEWIWNVDGVPVVLYRLPELIEAIAAEFFVLIVEGESKVDLLRSWNVPATCCAMGAGKWRDEHSAFLRDAHVMLLPNNDAPGASMPTPSPRRCKELPPRSACSSCRACRRRAMSSTGPRPAAPSSACTS